MAKILVAMSGGVDSSVAAMLLKKSGHEIKGVFMKNYEPPAGFLSSCNWRGDQKDVERVCRKLKIPWETWNFTREYANKVLKPFYRAYQRGQTPNPDVLCNREIKFGLFLKRAKLAGFQLVATGHYARVKKNSKGEVKLLCGKDKNKDQSYFLCALTQKQLQQVVFPVGGLLKEQVRELAKKYALPTAEKPDSQGICFVGETNLAELLKGEIALKTGRILSADGKILGQHRGLALYTIGQRHGLGISAHQPCYVAEKDYLKNSLVVVMGRKNSKLFHREVIAKDFSWLSNKTKPKKFFCQARVRYRQPLKLCQVFVQGQRLKVSFAKPVWAPAAGQVIAFYKNQECLGGAIIESARP
ncbi:tRNA 2-thiouridine(34) synthase MnmA [Candidatus Parcubacteria bacterium]|jgi:tRNA-specific 2-thiouridylase|nr:MAG: tRNA 2-thiouridine(34) synthase MnmA [Candidatus Parcubacteria bacterium]